MKKYFENGRFGMLVSLMLMVLSVVAGGGVMMAEGIVIPNDPVDADKNDLASPDGLGAGQDLTGTVASGTQARIGDIVEDEWDKEVAHYQEKKFPLDTMIRLRAKQSKATGYEVGHFREGSTVLDMQVTKSIAGDTATVTLNSSNVDGDVATFATHRLIAVNGVSGYVDGSSTEEEGTLILFVKSNDGENAVCVAVNGKSTEVGGPTTCPAIPPKTKLSALSNACYESQLVVAPSNFQPRPKVAFLQKHIFNYVITDHYKELMKKTPHAEKEIRDAAMYDFRRQRERNSLIGTQRKFLFNVPNMGKQYIYTSNGVLPQLINKFGVDEWDYATLIAISKMQFTDFSENSEADFFMGKNLLEKVQNIDFTKHKDIEYKGETVAGIEIVAFKSIFGKLNFIHCPQLDDLGMSDYGFICDLKNAVRYVKEAGKEDTKSMDDGSENAQEAERTRHIEIDAICLKGYNSMLVGPVDGIDNVKYTKSATNVTMMEALPENPTEGQKVFLTSTDGTYEGGHVYTYNGTKWDLAKS
jgi:hypothetical protein